MSDKANATERGNYSFWYEEKLRFSDIDMLRHVNNVAYAALIETARIVFLREGIAVPLPQGLLMVMVRIEIDYRAEMHFPATVQIGSRLIRVGRTSITVGNGVFRGEVCACTSVTTLVLIDSQTRRPVAISDEVRGALERHVN